MDKQKYRNELKHEINISDYYSLRPKLQSVMRLDPHSGADGRYHVRSLYFDNNNDRALKEKIYGLPVKEKYRIRIYQGDQSVIRLEKKSKRYGLCSKASTLLTRAQCEKIIAGDMAWIPDGGDPVLLEFYAKVQIYRLKPKTIVDYWREAYIFPFGNVRITFDIDVRSGLYATGLFDSALPTVTVSKSGTMLLEVKFDEFLPDVVRDIIQTNSRRHESFSKYAVSRIYG